MKTMHVKKGDTVRVITGKDKGKTGVVRRALPKEERIIVEGVALAKRHVKGGPGKVGHITPRPMPIHVSNVRKAL